MVRVSKDFIEDFIENVEANGSRRRLKKHVLGNIRVPSGGFETDLTNAEKEKIANCGSKTVFKIKLPGIYGWCKAVSYSSTNKPKSKTNEDRWDRTFCSKNK